MYYIYIQYRHVVANLPPTRHRNYSGEDIISLTLILASSVSKAQGSVMCREC